MNFRIKKIDYRVLLGVLLILGGLLGILEKLGAINNASGYFWAIIFGLAGVIFLYIFVTNREHWWSIIPGSALIGLALTIDLPENLNNYSGLAFLGAMGLGFLTIYIIDQKHWWAIIPSGVLFTLGIISLISNQMQGQDTGALFFVGLGITFFLVAILPNKGQPMKWAFIPATILMLFGTLLGTSFRGALDYIWIGALFCGGIYMIWHFLRTQKS
jgi:hypothetical protein